MVRSICIFISGLKGLKQQLNFIVVNKSQKYMQRAFIMFIFVAVKLYRLQPQTPITQACRESFLLENRLQSVNLYNAQFEVDKIS